MVPIPISIPQCLLHDPNSRPVYTFLQAEDGTMFGDGAHVTLFTNSSFFTGYPFSKVPTVNDVISRSRGITDDRTAQHVIYEDLSMIVKWGGRTSREEAAAMRSFNSTDVAEYSVVPQVYAVAIRSLFNWKTGTFRDEVFIYMEYIRGVTLENIYPTLTDWDKRAVVAQLGTFLTTMRSAVLSPPENMRIQSCLGGPVTDVVFTNTNTELMIPLDTVQQFSQYFMEYVQRPCRNVVVNRDTASIKLPDTGNIVLTHGNLLRSNIIVIPPFPDLGLGPMVVGIINWENAGWYPDYWEYSKAMSPKRDDAEWCTEYLPQALAPHQGYWRLIWPFTMRRWV